MKTVNRRSAEVGGHDLATKTVGDDPNKIDAANAIADAVELVQVKAQEGAYEIRILGVRAHLSVVQEKLEGLVRLAREAGCPNIPN